MEMQSWKPATWAAFRAGALTRAWRDVLLTLATFRGAGGRLYPSHATLAKRACCCVRTVQAALAAAREAGLMTWISGARRRCSNRYILLLPTRTAPARPPRHVTRAVGTLVRSWQGNGGQRSGRARPGPVAPVRTVAEQIAMLQLMDQTKGQGWSPGRTTRREG